MTRASLVALIFLVIGLLLLWIFLIRLIRRLTYKPIEGKPSATPPSVSYWSIALAVFLLSFSWMFFWMGHQLKSFKVFNPPGIIAQVELVNEHDPIKTLQVTFYSVLDDSLSKPTNFYLTGDSWKLEGRSVKIPTFLEPIFRGEHFYKVTDFYGAYKGHKPPGFDSALLEHQTIEGGMVDMFEYLGFFPFIRDIFVQCDFSTDYNKLRNRGNYDIALTDSCMVYLLDTK